MSEKCKKCNGKKRLYHPVTNMSIECDSCGGTGIDEYQAKLSHLETEVKRLREALEVYADEDNWRYVEVWEGEWQKRMFCTDGFGGKIAYSALEGKEKEDE